MSNLVLPITAVAIFVALLLTVGAALLMLAAIKPRLHCPLCGSEHVSDKDLKCHDCGSQWEDKA